MSVLVLLCTSYTIRFGPYWWPSSGGFVTQKFECSYCMSTDPLLYILKLLNFLQRQFIYTQQEVDKSEYQNSSAAYRHEQQRTI
jgi:hypothetical protein